MRMTGSTSEELVVYLQNAGYLWMVVNLKWEVLVDRMYAKAITGKSKEDLDALLFDRVADATAQILMMKRSVVGLDSKRSEHGERHVKIGWHATKRTVNRSSMTSRSC